MTKEELFACIEKEYGVTPDYPWLDSPEGAVFRHGDNRKWFALSMPIPRRYAYPGEDGEVDAVNRAGETVCRGRVLAVTKLPAYAGTAVVRIAVPIAMADEVRSMKRLPRTGLKRGPEPWVKDRPEKEARNDGKQ